MRAAGRERDVLVGVLVELLGALADVGGGLAGLADAAADRDDHGAVDVRRELVGVADRLPDLLRRLEDRRDGEGDERQGDDRDGASARGLPTHDERAAARHGFALVVAGRMGLFQAPAPANGAVGLIGVVLSQNQVGRTPVILLLARRPQAHPPGPPPTPSRSPRPVRPARRPDCPLCSANFASSRPSGSPVAIAIVDASHSASPAADGPGLGAVGVELRAERDQVRELADGRKVAQPGELLEADRVEVVAGQQPQIGVGAHDHARLAVVEEIALANRLDHERVSGGLVGRGRPGGDEGAERGGRGRVGDVRETTVSSERSCEARVWRAEEGMERSIIAGAVRVVEGSNRRGSVERIPARSQPRGPVSGRWRCARVCVLSRFRA